MKTEAFPEFKRELKFHPVLNPDPEILSKKQVKFFNENGYLKNLPLLSSDEVKNCKIFFDKLLKECLEKGDHSYSINGYHDKYSGIYKLMNHPKLIHFVKDLLGENVISWGAHYFPKKAGDIKTVAWHQDASYWPLNHSKTITVWLAMTDTNVENSCMRVINGSHLFGQIDFTDSKQDENNVLYQTVRNVDEFGEIINVELKAGEFSIHSDLLLHGSLANNSRNDRCGLAIRYCPSDVKIRNGWGSKSMLVAGKKKDSSWNVIPCPKDFYPEEKLMDFKNL